MTKEDGKYKVGIIGCGLIGKKRANALKQFNNSELLIAADISLDRAKELASVYGCGCTKNWTEVTRNKDINLVIVATTHNALAKITIDAIKNDKHVLVEKPAGRNLKELKQIVDEYERHKKIKIKVGFNHRFHPSFDKAKEIIKNGNIGEIMFIRARYGHGGRLGYAKEWRADKEISGGGELLDQGSHIIDLSRYFLGDFETAIGYCDTSFWKMEVEDNCFAILRTKKGQTAQFHASWTQWKNIFSVEIFCKTGQINIDGLGGSYGKETLTFYKMRPEMGPPDKSVYEWDDPDGSWVKEYQNFIEAIENNNEPNGDIYDAYESMKIAEWIYKWDEKFNDCKGDIHEKRD